MKKTIPLHALSAALLATALLGACATVQTGSQSTLYDFGLLQSSSAGDAPAALPPLSVAEPDAPVSMRSPVMFYRLAYANDQQPQAYAHNRWSMPPAQLLVQRLKARIGRSGGVVLAASDGAVNIPLLHIEVDDFIQVFESPGTSEGQIALRASVFQGRMLITQKNFVKRMPAPTADAAGGAKALAQASDAVIADILYWLAGLPLKR
jgi:cholesterol transport system auxiliary component